MTLTFPAYLSLRMHCSEMEALAVLHVRDLMQRLTADKAFGDGIHVLAVQRGRSLMQQSMATPARRDELFGQAVEAFELPLRLHGIIAQVDELEKEFKKRAASAQHRQEEEE